MADEQSCPPFNKPSPIPKEFGWDRLAKLDGDELEIHYWHTLEELGKRPGLLGLIFRKAQNKVQDPAKLRRLVADLIDKEEWSTLGVDVKGDAYEGLLQKNAEDSQRRRRSILLRVRLFRRSWTVMQPKPGSEPNQRLVICDPACGTGGFLLAAHGFIRHQKLDKSQLRYLKTEQLRGVELVDGVARLCAMNLLLHGIGGDPEAPVPILVKDALGAKHGEYEMVPTNPSQSRNEHEYPNEPLSGSREQLVLRDEPHACRRDEERPLHRVGHDKLMTVVFVWLQRSADRFRRFGDRHVPSLPHIGYIIGALLDPPCIALME
jgi:type I restriction enzyme M protein